MLTGGPGMPNLLSGNFTVSLRKRNDWYTKVSAYTNVTAVPDLHFTAPEPARVVSITLAPTSTTAVKNVPTKAVSASSTVTATAQGSLSRKLKNYVMQEKNMEKKATAANIRHL